MEKMSLTCNIYAKNVKTPYQKENVVWEWGQQRHITRLLPDC